MFMFPLLGFYLILRSNKLLSILLLWEAIDDCLAYMQKEFDITFSSEFIMLATLGSYVPLTASALVR
jgi:hypothetical protein